jgi:ketosteroid isomerase-like protein
VRRLVTGWPIAMPNIVATVLMATALLGCAQAPTRQGLAILPEAVVPDIARQFSACNLDALLANYSPAIEFVSPSTPTPIVGHVALRAHFAGACSGSVRPIMKVEAQRARMLSPEAAVVTGTYSFGRTDRPNDKPWPAFFVITLAREDERWLVNTQATFAVPPSASAR